MPEAQNATTGDPVPSGAPVDRLPGEPLQGPGPPRRAGRGMPILAGIGAACVAAFAATLCIRSINLADEGAIITQSFDLLQGRVLYRDMEAFVTPGIWFLVAATFKAFGASVFASRIPVFVGYLAMVFVSHRIVRRLAGRTSAWLAVGLLMVSTVWAFPAWTFAFYSPFSILFSLVALDRLLAWQESRRPLALFSCGLALGVAVAFKQNYGTFALLGTVAALIAFQLQHRDAARSMLGTLIADLARLAAGVSIAPLAVVIYFAANGALLPLYESLVVHPLEFAGQHEIPYLGLSRLLHRKVFNGAEQLTYGSFILNQTRHPFSYGFPPFQALGRLLILHRIHVLLYWVPVATFLGGLLLAVRPGPGGRHRDSGLLTLVLFSAFLYLGVFPRADYNHVMNVFQPVILAAVVVTGRFFQRHPAPHSKGLRLVTAFAGALLTLYVYAGCAWYLELLGAMDAEVDLPRGGVLVFPLDASLIRYEVATIRSMTREGEPVLTLPSLSMLNFLADRPLPTRYYNTWAHDVGHDKGAGVVADVEAHGVDLVVISYDNFFSDTVGMREYAPTLATHLRTHFEMHSNVANQKVAFLTRRRSPIVENAPLRFLDRCEFTDEPWPEQYSREHLLFPSLYQVHDPRFGGTLVETVCHLEIPAAAELVVALGYRRPVGASPGTTLFADLWVAHSDDAERIWRRKIPVQATQGWAAPPYPEYRIDLSRFAGQEVDLILRSALRGQVLMPPLDLVGFAMIWQDPRIESGE